MRTINSIAVAIAALLISSGLASASIIHLVSIPGLETGFSDKVTVAITPEPSAWQHNHPVNPGDPAETSAVWISYDLTGYGDAVFVPYGGQTPVGSIFQSFISGAGTMYLNVWADDTAGVFLDGVSLKAPVFSQSICSGAPIGCRPQDAGVIVTELTAGSHTLQFDLYQTGTGTTTNANPTGLLFTGTAPGADEPIETAPEPVSFLLLGSGLIATGVFARRRNTKT